MRLTRTRFARDIVAEVMHPPVKGFKGVLIICVGMPGVPRKDELLEFYARQGFLVIFPRYRGSWESDGSFLKISPHEDIVDIINQLPRGFLDLYDDSIVKVPRDQPVFIIASSFGGPAGILASRHPSVKKVAAICPIIDWTYPSEREPVDKMGAFIREAFGNGYRYHMSDWNKLKTGTFYNPMAEADTIDGKKLLLIHPEDDKVVPIVPTQIFADRTSAKLIRLKTGGHLRSSILMNPKIHKQVMDFFKKDFSKRLKKN